MLVSVIEEGAKHILKLTRNSLSLPIKEDYIIGKWYGILYRSKKRIPILYVGKVLMKFLEDKDGPVKSIKIECLMPKIGSGDNLKSTPKRLPQILVNSH